MRKWIALSVILPVLPLIMGGCNKVTGGGELTCIGPWEEVGLYFDAYGDDGWDLGSGVGGGVEYDRCSFGFTAKSVDDPETYWCEAKGQIQFVDHTQGIVLHCEIDEAGSAQTDPKGAEYSTAFWGPWSDEAPPGRITLPDGNTCALNYVDITVTTHRWALMDQTVYDPVTYPEWPYHPTIEEGYGDAICVWAIYSPHEDYWDMESFQWVGVVENGNLTTHKR